MVRIRACTQNYFKIISFAFIFALWGCEDEAFQNEIPQDMEDNANENKAHNEADLSFQGNPGFNRLSSDPRQAIQLEAFYALDPGYSGGSTKSINGWTISDWNYLSNDLNAYNVLKGWYGPCSSMWYGPHTSQSKKDPSSSTECQPYKNMGDNCFYHNPQNYGIFGSYGRGGQCKYFANLILYRSGAYSSMLPSYSSARSDYNQPDSKRKITKNACKAHVGDVIMTKQGVGPHTAIVVSVLAGTPGLSVTSVDVVDSNYVTWSKEAYDEEIIGRHIIDTSGKYGVVYGDLDNYFALKLTYR